MKIEMRDPKSLIPYENNAKAHPPEQVAAIAASIKAFKFDQPVVIDQDGVIVKGHGRTLAAISLGLTSIPCIVRDAPALENKLNRVLDNKLTSREYDLGALRDDLLALKDADKLSLSLYDEASIPLAVDQAVTPDINLFSLATDHKCPKCEYRW